MSLALCIGTKLSRRNGSINIKKYTYSLSGIQREIEAKVYDHILCHL